MESRCCLMHRLKKAVRASLVLLSLLFYVFGLHVHYVNRTVTAIGALKDSEPEVQQQALHYIMSGETNTRDGEYVLMKNGYHRGGTIYCDRMLSSILQFTSQLFSSRSR
mgnify:CR=1 FL=1